MECQGNLTVVKLPCGINVRTEDTFTIQFPYDAVYAATHSTSIDLKQIFFSFYLDLEELGSKIDENGYMFWTFPFIFDHTSEDRSNVTFVFERLDENSCIIRFSKIVRNWWIFLPRSAFEMTSIKVILRQLNLLLSFNIIS